MSKIWQTLNTDSQKLSLFGTILKIITSNNDDFQGVLYYYDDNIIILSIRYILLENEQEYYLINQLSIQDFQILNIQDSTVININNQNVMQNLMQIDLSKLAQEMIKQEIKEPHQLLYDHLLKLYRDVEWKGEEIIIPSIQIRIISPYKSECIFGENKKAVDRLKKIVDKYGKI